MILGTILTIMWVFVIITKKDVKETKGVDQGKLKSIIAEAEKMGSIKYRFTETDRLVKKQLEMVKQVYQPSKGASHAKWKNDLIKHINDLEKEKILIFKSIVKDGVDPTLQLMDPDGNKEEMKMSDAIKRAETNSDFIKPDNLKKKTDSKSHSKDGSNLIHFDFKKGKKNEPTDGSTKETD